MLAPNDFYLQQKEQEVDLCDDNIERKRYKAAPDLGDDPVVTKDQSAYDFVGIVIQFNL